MRRGVPLDRHRSQAHGAGSAGRSAFAITARHQCRLAEWMGHVIVKEGLLDRRISSTSGPKASKDWLKTVKGLHAGSGQKRLTGVPAHLISRGGSALCEKRRVHVPAWSRGDGTSLGKSWGYRASVTWRWRPEISESRAPAINPLRGQNNVQGASDIGCLPTYFSRLPIIRRPRTGHSASDQVTGRPLPTQRGMKMPDMWEAAMDGRLKGFWIIGYDVAQTDPNLKKVHAGFSQCRISYRARSVS